MPVSPSQSIFDTQTDAAAEAAADAAADLEIESGLCVPHERVREWLLKLANGEKVPPPTA